MPILIREEDPGKSRFVNGFGVERLPVAADSIGDVIAIKLGRDGDDHPLTIGMDVDTATALAGRLLALLPLPDGQSIYVGGGYPPIWDHEVHADPSWNHEVVERVRREPRAGDGTDDYVWMAGTAARLIVNIPVRLAFDHDLIALVPPADRFYNPATTNWYVNPIYGRQVRDLVLKHFGDRIAAHARALKEREANDAHL